MEENKDLKEMQENAESSIEDTEEIVEETVEEAAKEDVAEETSEDEKSDVAEETSEDEKSEENTEITEATEEKPKSKKVLNTSIIIAIVIFAGALLVFGGFYLGKTLFFNNSVVGSWVIDPEYTASMSSPDEATEETSPEMNTYLIFTDEEVEGTTDGQKIAKFRSGTLEQMGSYITTDNGDGTQTVLVSIGYSFYGNFTQTTVTGNMFTGRKLSLVDDNGTELPLVSASIPAVSITVPEDFEVNEQLVGEWKDEMYNYTYIFNADGTAFIDFGGSLTVEGTYVATDEVVTITFINGEEMSVDYPYAFDEDTLVINGLGYKKVTE